MMDGSEEEWDSPNACPNSCTATVNRSVVLLSPEDTRDKNITGSLQGTCKKKKTPKRDVLLSHIFLPIFHICIKKRLDLILTSIAPDLLIIKVCVSSHFPPTGEEGVGQGATLPIKGVPVIVEQAVKRHPDIPFVVCRHSAEIQGGCVAPSFEGVTQEGVHQAVCQAR